MSLNSPRSRGENVAALTAVMSDRREELNALCNEFGLSSASAFWLPLNQRQEFLKRLENLEQGMALRLGTASSLAAMGSIGFLLQSSKHLRDAAEAMVHYGALMSASLADVQFSKQQGMLCLTIDSGRDALEQQFAIALALQLMQQCCGPACRPRTIRCQQDSALPTALRNIIDGIELATESGAVNIELLFDAHWWDAPLPGSNPKVRELLRREVEQEFRHLQHSDSAVDRVCEYFDSCESLLEVNIDRAAEALATSKRTLTRKLESEATSFREVLNSYRHRKAVSLLLAQRDINEIAYYLGFSERSAFERAFSKSLGMRPAQLKELYGLMDTDNQSYDILNPDSLPILSTVGLEIVQLMQDDDFDIEDLADIVTQDAVLTGKIIGLANSAFYGTRNIATVYQAIVRVFGVEKVKSLALALMSQRSFKVPSIENFSVSSYWFNSLVSAELARQFEPLLSTAEDLDADQLYLAGLLMGLGSLFLAEVKTDAMRSVYANYEPDNYSLEAMVEAEMLAIGVNRYQATAMLLSHWGLPANIVKLVRQIGEFKTRTEVSAEVILLRRLEEIAVHLEYQNEDELNSEEFDNLAMEMNWSKDRVDKISERFIDRYAQFKVDALHLIDDRSI